jgi:hypothetical protein
MQTPRWLVGCVVGVVATTAALSVGWWGVCAFFIGPNLFQAAMAGKIKEEPKVCENADERAIQVLTGLLATLLALMGNAPTSGDR